MDAYHDANARSFRQRQLDNVDADIKQYRDRNIRKRGTPEYKEGLEKLRKDLDTRMESADALRAREKEALQKDHGVMDIVERHTGNRTRNDYVTLDVERLRRSGELSESQGVLGVLSDRYKNMSTGGGLAAESPQAHLKALKEMGLDRRTAKTFLLDWYWISGNPDHVKGINRFNEEYLDWVGLK